MPTPKAFGKVRPEDVNIKPFKTFKRWTFTNNTTGSYNINILQGVYDEDYVEEGTSASLAKPKNADGSYQSVIYDSINHMFYKYASKTLHLSASVMSIPSQIYGERIRPLTYALTGSYTVVDDGNGNLIDSGYSVDNIVSGSWFYEGFNDFQNTSKYTGTGNWTFDIGTGSAGHAFLMDGKSNMRFDMDSRFDFDTNFTVSFFYKHTTQTSGYILGKHGLDKNGIVTNKYSMPYPFSFYVDGDEMNMVRYDGLNQTRLQSAALVPDRWYHVLGIKSGSSMAMYIDGTTSTTFDKSAFTTNNYSPLYMGSFNDRTGFASGSIDEVRIFNYAVPTSERAYLSGSTYLQTNKVGEIFYESGFVIINSLDPAYKDILTGSWSCQFRGTNVAYEYEIIVRVPAGEFNLSTNRSLVKNSIYFKDITQNSEFSPYITTIGLYDSFGRLLAVGKPARPVKKRNDVDINFVIRFDLDI